MGRSAYLINEFLFQLDFDELALFVNFPTRHVLGPSRRWTDVALSMFLALFDHVLQHLFHIWALQFAVLLGFGDLEAFFHGGRDLGVNCFIFVASQVDKFVILAHAFFFLPHAVEFLLN